jgi:general secretion pathway protein D
MGGRARGGTGVRASLRALPAVLLIASCTAQKAPAPAAQPAAEAPALKFPPAPPQKIGTEAIPNPAPPTALVHEGSLAPARTVAAGGPPVVVSPGGDVTLNFADADIREVVRAIVGNILGLNYYIDSKVQGTLTVETTRPLPRAAVLPTLERVLRASGAALVEDNGLVRIMPLDGTEKSAPLQGNAIRILPLQYMTADQLQKVVQPFVPLGASLQTDSAHNVMVLSGTSEDMDSLVNLIRSFDTDWLSRMSFALVPLRNGTADAIASQMQEIVAAASGSSEASAANLRLVAVPQLEAILVITSQQRYLAWAQQQIELLDTGSADSTERTYIYHVQYGRASDLADVLSKIFGSGAATSSAAKSSSSSSSYLQPASSLSSLTAGFGTGGLTSATGTMGLGAAAPGTEQTAGTAPSPAPASSTPGATSAAGTGTAATPASPAAPAEGEAAAQPSAPGTESLRFVTDERNNAIVVVATPRQYRRIEEALKRLDVKPMQVEIAATIAEVTLNDELQYGLQWFFRQHNNSEAFTNTTTSAPGQVFPGFSYQFLLPDANVQVVLNALSTITTVNVVSSPQLLVLNNQTAQLQVGQQVPVPVEQQQSTLVAGAPLVNTINYVDTGVILSVTPRANSTGEVTLDIEQEVSDVASTTTGGLDAPTLDERRIKSTVSVDSGETVALGGLISTSVTKNRTAIPLLGSIPVVGALFRNDDNTTMRTELLVLIEPHIINGTDDARAATDQLERRMQDIAPIPPAMR